MKFITAYLDQYGYAVLFLALMLELLALPFPGEVLMSYTGFLVYQGHLNWFTSIVVAGTGSSIGMTFAYLIGLKLGTPFFEKYGSRIHLGPDRLEKTSKWFSKYGNKLLVIAYFLPGVRHFTGYFSGITRLTFRTFALYAYSGAFLWVTTFITIGKILGPQWEKFHASIKKYLIIGGMITVVIFAAVYVYRNYKEQIKDAAVTGINRAIHLFHTRRRTGIFIAVLAVITLALSVLMIGIIQDFIGNDFRDFNEITALLVPLIFDEQWTSAMLVFLSMGSGKVLAGLLILTLLWILWRGRDKVLETISFLIAIAAGELYQESLSRIFHRLAPVKNSLIEESPYSFPSEQSLTALVIYGYAVYMFVRHTGKPWVHTFAAAAALGVLLFIAISRVFFEIQYPSDIAAGYVFGGVWLSLNILVLELLRLLRKVDFSK